MGRPWPSAALLTITCAVVLAGRSEPAAADEFRELGSPKPARHAERALRPGTNAHVVRVRLAVNKSDTVRLDMPFNDVLVGSSKIVDVMPLNTREIYLLGKEVGTTSVSVLDQDKRLQVVLEVEVGLDTGNIAAKVAAAIGSRSIRVGSEGNKIILSGSAPDAPTLDRAVTIASALVPEGGAVINMARVAAPQQVMLRVRLVEVNRQASRELGFRLEQAGRRLGARTGHVGTNAPLSTTGNSGRGLLSDLVPAVGSATLQRTSTPPFGQILGRFAGSSQQLDAIISALEEKGLARRLAEPNLVALSGDTADFLAGGEFPVPVAGSTQTGVPTITVAFKEFGVRLSFTPTVLSGGAINLRLDPEVSEIDPSVSVNTGVVSVPGLSKRRARTTVELRDGQSFAIAGLLQAVTLREIEQFPWLGSVPVLGALLRSASFQQRETELVVIVTPHLVQPAKPGTVLETPLDTHVSSNDADLFLMGELDRKKPRAPVVEPYIPPAGTVSGRHGHILPAATATTGSAPGRAATPAAPALRVRN